MSTWWFDTMTRRISRLNQDQGPKWKKISPILMHSERNTTDSCPMWNAQVVYWNISTTYFALLLPDAFGTNFNGRPPARTRMFAASELEKVYNRICICPNQQLSTTRKLQHQLQLLRQRSTFREETISRIICLVLRNHVVCWPEAMSYKRWKNTITLFLRKLINEL